MSDSSGDDCAGRRWNESGRVGSGVSRRAFLRGTPGLGALAAAGTIGVAGTATASTLPVPPRVWVVGRTATTVEVAWDAPDTGDYELTGYDYYVDGTQHLPGLDADETSVVVNDLDPETTYEVGIVATYVAGDADVVTVEATTNDEHDETPPEPPANLRVAERSQHRLTLAWDEPEDPGESGVFDYDVYLDGSIQNEVYGPRPETEVELTGLDDDTTYEVEVVATDYAYNDSEPATIQASTAAYDDSEPPGPPDWIDPLRVGATTALVEWAESSDADSGVEGYALYVDGEPAATTDSVVDTEHELTGLPTGATVDLAVAAVDRAGNESPRATTTVETLAEPDESPPPSPVPQATETTSSSITVEWSPVQDAESSVAYYVLEWSEENLPAISTVPIQDTSYTIDGLGSGDVTVRVEAVDQAGNQSEGFSRTFTRDTGDGEAPPQIGDAPPQDLNDDGRYRDVNGNDRLDSDDVVTFFDHMDEPAVTDHVDAYDFNDNDRIDFDDVVTLFESL